MGYVLAIVFFSGQVSYKQMPDLATCRAELLEQIDNGAYKHIDREEFRKDVLSGLDKPTIQKKHNLGSTAFTNKMLDVFNTSKIREARKLYNSTLVQP